MNKLCRVVLGVILSQSVNIYTSTYGPIATSIISSFVSVNSFVKSYNDNPKTKSHYTALMYSTFYVSLISVGLIKTCSVYGDDLSEISKVPINALIGYGTCFIGNKIYESAYKTLLIEAQAEEEANNSVNSIFSRPAAPH